MTSDSFVNFFGPLLQGVLLVMGVGYLYSVWNFLDAIYEIVTGSEFLRGELERAGLSGLVLLYGAWLFND